MSELSDKIKRMQDSISTNQSNLDRLKGMMETYRSTLKINFKKSTIKEAISYKEEIDSNISTIESEILKDISKFEQKYPQLRG